MYFGVENMSCCTLIKKERTLCTMENCSEPVPEDAYLHKTGLVCDNCVLDIADEEETLNFIRFLAGEEID